MMGTYLLRYPGADRDLGSTEIGAPEALGVSCTLRESLLNLVCLRE